MEPYYRIIDGDCDGSALIDIGAYEYGRFAPGNLNGDCIINMIDFSIFVQGWNTDINEELYRSATDIDTNGTVDLEDLAIIATGWLGIIE